MRKSMLDIVSKGLSTVAAPALIGADYGTGSNQFWMFNQTGGFDYKFSYTGHTSAVKAYQKCAPLTSIINKKTEAYLNGHTWIINTQGKAKGKEANGSVAERVRSLMARPNPLQNWKQFEAQQKIYVQLFGFSIVLPMGVPVGFPNYEATSMWNIPPFMVDIEETEKLFFQSGGSILKKIVLNYKNSVTVLNVDQIFIFKDITPSFSSLFIPESRVCALEMPINNIIGAYESRNVLINYRGALGIISPDAETAGTSLPLKEEDKIALQQQFLTYGLKNNQWKFILSTAKIKWQQMGVPTKDLMLFEEIDDSIQRICDQYNYPYRLLSSEKSNSLGGADLKVWKTELYEGAIIPEAANMYEQWNQFFGLATFNLRIEKDYSHVPALQEDAGKKATARKTNNEARQIEFFNNLCTMNEWRESNGDDPLEGDNGKKYYYELRALGWEFGKTGATAPAADNNNQQQNENGNAGSN